MAHQESRNEATAFEHLHHLVDTRCRDHEVPKPLAPRFTGRFAFLIDGRVLSAAESLIGVVEGEHLGALVGGPTAGTNGGMDPFDVAGDHTLRWTGMDIRKKDGSPHLGVGIKPTVPVRRTLAGVTAGRDELLEKGSRW